MSFSQILTTKYKKEGLIIATKFKEKLFPRVFPKKEKKTKRPYLDNSKKKVSAKRGINRTLTNFKNCLKTKSAI